MKYLIFLAAIIIFVYAVRLGELYTQSGRYQAYWERRNKLPGENNQKMYIALGDSTAQGIGANKPQNGYVGYIARALEKDSQPVKLLNFSKTGAKLSDAINEQLPKLKESKITSDTIITIEIGANDMKTFEAEKFEREVDQLMGELPEQTVISDIPYFGAGLNRGSEPNVKQSNKIMYKLAKKHGFQLASLYDKTKSNTSLRTFSADLFHPSSYGYKVNWAPVFLERINKGAGNEKF